MKITQEELTRMRDAASRGQASPRDMRRVLDALDASEAEAAWLSECLAGACVKNRSGRCFLDGVCPHVMLSCTEISPSLWRISAQQAVI